MNNHFHALLETLLAFIVFAVMSKIFNNDNIMTSALFYCIYKIVLVEANLKGQ